MVLIVWCYCLSGITLLLTLIDDTIDLFWLVVFLLVFSCFVGLIILDFGVGVSMLLLLGVNFRLICLVVLTCCACLLVLILNVVVFYLYLLCGCCVALGVCGLFDCSLFLVGYF